MSALLLGFGLVVACASVALIAVSLAFLLVVTLVVAVAPRRTVPR